MTKGDVQEALVALYLRLNGYFTTGFIAQSATPGQVTTELDVLAVRLPHNAEPERIIGGAEELNRWDGGLDFIIGEVKSRGQSLQFNDQARTALAVSKFLQWWGHLSAEEVAANTPAVQAILQPLPGATVAPTVECPRDARVRAILFGFTRALWSTPGASLVYSWAANLRLHLAMPAPSCTAGDVRDGLRSWPVGSGAGPHRRLLQGRCSDGTRNTRRFACPPQVRANLALHQTAAGAIMRGRW